jgi:hypothetical protein
VLAHIIELFAVSRSSECSNIHITVAYEEVVKLEAFLSGNKFGEAPIEKAVFVLGFLLGDFCTVQVADWFFG